MRTTSVASWREIGMKAIRTARWNDPATRRDGTRILVCRFRPRALRKEDETWREWNRAVAPSKELVAAFYGKHAPPIEWGEYRKRYLAEMRAPEAKQAIAALADRAAHGEAMTLLCSRHCVDPARCHRSLLADLIEREVKRRTRTAKRAA